ncbi:MAG: DUF2845 domain-containing protein [Pseudomonadota bacterium]
MKYRFLALALSLAAGSAQATLRCDQGIASEGDRTVEVQSKCGEPVSRNLVGYTQDSQGNNELQIEEWVYGPRNGMNYYLTFEGGRLKAIESKRGN